MTNFRCFENTAMTKNLINLDIFFINQDFHIALNPFFDMGQVIQPYRLDEQKAAGKMWEATYGTADPNPFYSGKKEKLHATAGCGAKIVMNRNFVISVEFARAFNSNDGKKLWNNIGFNYLF